MPIIASRQNPLVRRFREAIESPGTLLLEGPHLLNEALTCGVRLQVVALTASVGESPAGRELSAHLEKRGIPVKLVSEQVMSALSPVPSPSGWVALGTAPSFNVNDVFENGQPLVLAAINVQDPGNLGAVVRAAAAGGATGVLTAGHSANPFGWKALRGAMGSVFRIPVVPRTDIHDVLNLARSRHVTVLGTAPRGGTLLHDVDLARPIVVLLGGEGGGLPIDVISLADEILSIPMRRDTESLNVAVTAALVVYEAMRQRLALDPTVPQGKKLRGHARPHR